MEGKCYCCGKTGHKSPQCHHKEKPKSEWAINKTPELMQVQNVMSEASTIDDASTAAASLATAMSTDASHLPFSWMATQRQITGVSAAQHQEEMREWILLDNQFLVDLFCNPALVEDITDVDETLILAMNAGDLSTRISATVPEYGKVWFSKKAMTNVFSLHQWRTSIQSHMIPLKRVPSSFTCPEDQCDSLGVLKICIITSQSIGQQIPVLLWSKQSRRMRVSIPKGSRSCLAGT
jgi:hypothetical protein